MNTRRLLVAAIWLWRTACSGYASTWYVTTVGDDSAAGTNWSTAKRTIQAAIDVAIDGDTVLVTNGTYNTGGRTLEGGFLTNRIVITRAITVQSVDSTATCIMGQADPTTHSNGDAAVRCAYVGANARLSGFALQYGYTRANSFGQETCGGGVLCDPSAVVSNCFIVSNHAFGSGGGAYGGTLNNCYLFFNEAGSGGGAYGGTLNFCSLYNNMARWEGGGSHDSTLNNCMINANTAGSGGVGNGGGTSGGTLNNCDLRANKAEGMYGGGSYESTLNNCSVRYNSSFYNGGGAAWSVLNNCTLVKNSALHENGGGAYFCGLNNCTLVGNSASNLAGGTYSGVLNNCIVYSNTARDQVNYHDSSFNYSCATPMPTNGTGNIACDPQFVDAESGDVHLRAASPCTDRGNNAYATNSATDLDGNQRILFGVVDMGAYECQVPGGYWQWVHVITNGQTNLTDCALGDGYPNLLKYATGSSPTNCDNLAAMNLGTRSDMFSLVFNRNTNASDVTLIVEGSASATNDAPWIGVATNLLGSWGDAQNVTESGTGMTVVVTVQDVSPSSTNRFLRLRVKRP